MKKLITKVKIGCRDWKVYLVDPKSKEINPKYCINHLSYVQEREPSDDVLSPLGLTVFDTYSIYISNIVSHKNAKSVIIHEVHHALLDSYGLTIEKIKDVEAISETFAATCLEEKAVSDEIYKAYKRLIKTLRLNKKVVS